MRGRRTDPLARLLKERRTQRGALRPAVPDVHLAARVKACFSNREVAVPMSESKRDRIVEALTADVSPLREEAITVLVDHVLGRKLRELADFEEVSGLVIGALTEDNLARVIERHVEPGFQRYLAAAVLSEELVGALVPDPARDGIRSIVRKSRLPAGAWTAGLVEPALIRKLFAPVWVQLLLAFGSRLPLPGMGAASGAAAAAARGMGGIAGRLTRSVQERAEKIADAGRSVMGGLGAEVEKRIQAAARDFSDGAADIFRDALGDRLKSPEGRALVDQIAGQVIDHVMTTKLSDIQKDLEALDVAGIFDVVAPIVAHAAPRAFVRNLVTAEVRAYLELEGDRTLSELLTEFGVLSDVREMVLRRSGNVARTLFASPEFGEFLGRLLDA